MRHRTSPVPALTGLSLWLSIQVPLAFGPQSQRSDIPVPNEYLPYLHARSVIAFSARELIQFAPELKNVEYAQSQAELPALLDRVGKNVEAYFRDYPNTTALENVYQERQEPGGRIDEYLKRKYHYVVSVRAGADELGLDEYRTNLREELIDPEELKGGYLLTSGHSSAPLYFHPRHRQGCDFRLLGREKSPRQAYVVAFAQNAEMTQSSGTITLHGKEVTILEQGFVWVAPDSGQILRMRSDLLVPRPDVHLDQHSAVIDFSEVTFKTISHTLWLPKEVQVVVKFEGWKFQNRHRYSQYRLFSVESQDGPKKLARPSP